MSIRSFNIYHLTKVKNKMFFYTIFIIVINITESYFSMSLVSMIIVIILILIAIYVTYRQKIQQWLRGPEGPQGLQGIPGQPGNEGPQGIPGPQGIDGPPGPQGQQGVPGQLGAQGLQGINGKQGLQGLQGLTGPQGLQGIDGKQGLQGLTGPQGLQGIPGPQGLQGLPGPGAFDKDGNLIMGSTAYPKSWIFNTVAGTNPALVLAPNKDGQWNWTDQFYFSPQGQAIIPNGVLASQICDKDGTSCTLAKDIKNIATTYVPIKKYRGNNGAVSGNEYCRGSYENVGGADKNMACFGTWVDGVGSKGCDYKAGIGTSQIDFCMPL